jgi:hypothetical protein
VRSSGRNLALFVLLLGLSVGREGQSQPATPLQPPAKPPGPSVRLVPSPPAASPAPRRPIPPSPWLPLIILLWPAELSDGTCGGDCSEKYPPREVAAIVYTLPHTLDAPLKEKIRKALNECADAARSTIIARYFGKRGPTREECNEKVGQDRKGRPITRAEQLGNEQHEIALKCVEKKLSELKPDGFSIKPRYRRNARTGDVEHLPAEKVETLLREGRASELLGTIEPDLVLHAGGAPHSIQAVHDFKFPCLSSHQSRWREYSDGPHQGRTQGEVYKELLGVEPGLVSPRGGGSR